MNRKVEPLSVTLKSIVEILHKVNTTEDRAELIDPLLVNIEGMLLKLADPIEKVYWEGLDDLDGDDLIECLLVNPPVIPRGFA